MYKNVIRTKIIRYKKNCVIFKLFVARESCTLNLICDRYKASYYRHRIDF